MEDLEVPDAYTKSQQMVHDLMAPIRAAQTYVGFALEDLDNGDAASARVHAAQANEALNESMGRLVDGLVTEVSPE